MLTNVYEWCEKKNVERGRLMTIHVLQNEKSDAENRRGDEERTEREKGATSVVKKQMARKVEKGSQLYEGNERGMGWLPSIYLPPTKEARSK